MESLKEKFRFQLLSTYSQANHKPTVHTLIVKAAAANLDEYGYDDKDVFDSRRATFSESNEYPDGDDGTVEASDSGKDSAFGGDGGEEHVHHHRRKHHYHHRKSDNETANPKGDSVIVFGII